MTFIHTMFPLTIDPNVLEQNGSFTVIVLNKPECLQKDVSRTGDESISYQASTLDN